VIPTVSLIVDISTSIDGSWHDGQILLQYLRCPSALRYATDPHDQRVIDESLLVLYADSGPDNTTAFILTQLALIALIIFSTSIWIISVQLK